MGYVEPVLVRYLRSRMPGAEVHGFDSGFSLIRKLEHRERLKRCWKGSVLAISGNFLHRWNGWFDDRIG
ncbi:hypothetical protein ASD03_19910 [Ensifer sp. Root127]|nr:hypothetical protein ASD03_19910 [Ensifer sp. Root127]